jgi:hypothetical protein
MASSLLVLDAFNSLLRALLIPISLDTFDAVPPALLVAALESLLEVRLLTATVRASQDRSGRLQCVKILLGSLVEVLEDEFLQLGGAEVGIAELAEGEAVEVEKVARMLLGIADRMGLVAQSSVASLSKPMRVSTSTASPLRRALDSATIAPQSPRTPRRSTLTRMRASEPHTAPPMFADTTFDDVFSCPAAVNTIRSERQPSRSSREMIRRQATTGSPTPPPRGSSSQQLQSLQLIDDSDDSQVLEEDEDMTPSPSVCSHHRPLERRRSFSPEPDYDTTESTCVCHRSDSSPPPHDSDRSSMCSTISPHQSPSPSPPPHPSQTRPVIPRTEANVSRLRIRGPSVKTGFIDIVSDVDTAESDNNDDDDASTDGEEGDSYTGELLRRRRTLLRRLDELRRDGTSVASPRRKSGSGEGIRVAVRRL